MLCASGSPTRARNAQVPLNQLDTSDVRRVSSVRHLASAGELTYLFPHESYNKQGPALPAPEIVRATQLPPASPSQTNTETQTRPAGNTGQRRRVINPGNTSTGTGSGSSCGALEAAAAAVTAAATVVCSRDPVRGRTGRTGPPPAGTRSRRAGTISRSGVRPSREAARRRQQTAAAAQINRPPPTQCRPTVGPCCPATSRPHCAYLLIGHLPGRLRSSRRAR